MLKNGDLQILGLKLNKHRLTMSNFQPLQAVGSGSETTSSERKNKIK